MNSIEDVTAILQRKKDNLTARRWLSDIRMLQKILLLHLSVNAYHAKIGYTELLQPLEESIEDYLLNPSFIDDQLK